MFTKRYMYETERSSCLEILQNGFAKLFEEAFPLRKILKPAMHFLKEAEKYERLGDREKYLQERLKAGDHLQEFEWLSKYFYKSSSKLSYQLLAEMEEKSGNYEDALKCLKKALLEPNDKEQLWIHVMKVYHVLGPGYLLNKKELKCFEDLMDYPSKSLPDKSAGYRLLAKAMLMMDRTEEAIQNFQQSISISEQSKDIKGLCEAYLSMSEVYSVQIDPEETLKTCYDLAEEHSLNMFVVVSALRLGQLKTVKRDYDDACHYFDLAYKIAECEFPQWVDLCSVMCGVGRANATFKTLIKTFNNHDSLKYLLRWRGACYGLYGSLKSLHNGDKS